MKQKSISDCMFRNPALNFLSSIRGNIHKKCPTAKRQCADTLVESVNVPHHCYLRADRIGSPLWRMRVPTAPQEVIMNVARILKDKGRDVTTILPALTIKDVIGVLAEKKIGAAVICDPDLRVAGIISERDIVRILAANGPAVLDEPVSKFMTKEVMTCVERDTVHWLMEEMTSRRFRHMPVVEGGRLAGIVSIGDVVKQRIAVAELEAASMREYITTG
jgi:CBS domain-containing protein